ncbi:odorant receptor 2a-like [Zootermopsis nevadensis]|uniref:odorant receptor 2a-like n=1 Tax=Zootermopsis nevadensis TaxID=136037 RepID=UPI000B8EADD4|nr:odorant receptor 2a-like [Zootermopsis nevadensis]
MKDIRALLGMQLVVWIHLFFRFRKREIAHLLALTDSFTWEELPTKDPETGRLTKAGYLPVTQKIASHASALIYTFHFVQSSVRIATSHDKVFPAWFPFDTTVNPAYAAVNLVQAIGSLFITCAFAGFLSLYATFICVACSQLEKLRAAILDIRQTYITLQQECGAETNKQDGEGHPLTPEELFGHMQKQLNDCIRHHQQIKRFMQANEDCWNFVLCALFLLMLSAMCFVAFSAITSWGDHVDVSQAVVIYLAMLSCLCVFCWLGTELSKEAESVRDAAWGCDWVGTPVPFQRCLMFIIAAANKEFTLTAGKFVPVSNKTMMNMMNQSASFFMFLLNMKDKNIKESGTE